MKKIIAIAVFLLTVSLINSEAKVILPSLVGNNMVLQQNANVRVWGWSIPANKIEVSVSWTKETYSCKSDKDGYWEVIVPTPRADHQAHVMMINDGEPLAIYNILLGEVWVAGGQSNMKFPLGGLWNSYVPGNNSIIAHASDYPEIRMFTVVEETSPVPQKDCKGQWQEPTPENLISWSAVAYSFAKNLNTVLNVPVGIINSSWGGTIIEAWMAKEDLTDFNDVDYSPITDTSKPVFARPYMMYNAMIKPLTKYVIRGFIFYQGCSNVWTADTYAMKMSKMVERWRKDWGLGQLPFYYVEIAPFNYGWDNIQGALLRESQFEAQKLIPNSGMVSIYDLCEGEEPANAHPTNKMPVGERLSYYALNQVYGIRGISCSYPSYREMEIVGREIHLSFDYGDCPDLYPWNNLKGFEISGEDGFWRPAYAYLNLATRKIVVWSEQIDHPINVRYCFRNVNSGNVTNTRGLPLIPFRTDK